jgi:hypothetical protein
MVFQGRMIAFCSAVGLSLLSVAPARSVSAQGSANPAPAVVSTTDSAAIRGRIPLPRAGSAFAVTDVTEQGRNASASKKLLAGNAWKVAAPNKSQSKTLMFVGLAALIGGLAIDDDAGDVIAVGGLVMGLFGLYYYLE